MSNSTWDYNAGIQLPLAIRITLALGLAIIIIVATTGNAILCILVCQKKTMRSPINILLANLALTDVLLAVLCMPMDLVTLFAISWLSKMAVLCQFHAFLTSALMTANKIFLFVISIDRYSIIVNRTSRLTQRSCQFIVVALYLYSIGICIGPVLDTGLQTHCGMAGALESISSRVYVIVRFLATIIIPYSVMAYSYFWILVSVRKNKLKVGVEPSMMIVFASKGSTNNSQAVLRTVPCLSIDMRFKTRTFKTILILFVISVLCHLPSSALQLKWSLDDDLPSDSSSFIMWSMYLNSALNPLIYACRIQKFREVCHMLMFPLSCIPTYKSLFKKNENSQRLYRIKEHISTISR